jgi:hypothetical protein
MSEKCPNCGEVDPDLTIFSKDSTRYYYCKSCIKNNQEKLGLSRDILKKIYNGTESQVVSRNVSKLARSLDTLGLDPVKEKHIGTGGRTI